MSEREYIKFNTSVQVASNAQRLIKDDDGNIAAILELRLPDNIFPAENGNKKVDSVQMLTTKMRISMENTPIAQFGVDEDTMKKLEKLNRSSNVAFITTSQLDLYPYMINDGNQIQPSKANSAFPLYKTRVLSIEISIWMGEDYILLDTLYVHPNAPSSFAEDVGRYKDPFQKGGVFAALGHLSNLVVKQHMPVRRENDTVSIFNVGSIELMLQDGIESAFIYNNTDLVDPLQCSIFFISEEAYNNNHFPTGGFTKNDVDVENTMVIEEMGGIKAFFVNKVNGPVVIDQMLGLPNIRFSVKPKVSFTEQKFRISYDTAPFTSNIPLLWCNSFVNTYDNPLQLTLGNVYDDYCDGFKPPKRLFSYGATKNEDDSYFFTLKESTINPVNIVGNKALRDIFSCLPWIAVDTNTNQFFSSRSKSKYRINQKKQTKTTSTNSDVVRAKYQPSTPGTPPYALRKYVFNGIDGTNIAAGLTDHCFHYSFIINREDINLNETAFNKRFPKVKRMSQNIQYNGERYLGTVSVTFDEIQRKSNENTQVNYGEMKTYNTVEYNYETSFPSSDVNEIYSSPVEETVKIPLNTYTVTTGGNTETRTLNHGALGAFQNENQETEYYLLEPPQGNWTYNGDLHRAWLPLSEPDYINLNEAPDTRVTVDVYWNIPQTEPESWHISLMTSTNSVWWNITYDNVDAKQETFYKQDIVETLDSNLSVDELLFNFLPNVDLDEKGRFYVLDGTTTNLTLGQQEVIEGPMNYMYDITTTTTISHATKITNEVWNGTKDGVPYVQILDRRYQVTARPELAYRYQLIDPTQQDIPSNRTNQYIIYNGVDMSNLIRTNVAAVLNYASLQDTRTNYIAPVTETNVTHETSSSTEYPEGETVLPDEYTNWEVVSNTQTITSDEEEIASIGSLLDGVELLENSNDTYWHIGDGAISDDPMYRCVPSRPYDRFSSLDGGWFLQRWYLNAGSELSLYISKRITSSNSLREQRDKSVTAVTVVKNSNQEWFGNVRVNFEWDNIPIVVISPIQSIVLTLQGMNVSQEIHPINVAQAGGSSLVSTIPIIENYYSLAETLRDLHDELVVIKDSYDDQATYSLNTTSGQERVLRIMAQYITKDGRLHQIYIPPNGVYSLQLTFGIAYYFSS